MAYIIIDNDTEASAYNTAAVVITGGIGVAKNIRCNSYIYGTGGVYGAFWNDLADSIEIPKGTKVEPGYCYSYNKGKYNITSKYADSHFIGIHSDTYGFKMGDRECDTLDIAVAGFVLAHVDKEYKSGTPLVCTKCGKLTKARFLTRIIHPERIIGSYWKPELSKYWGNSTRKVEVKNRHWIKIK